MRYPLTLRLIHWFTAIMFIPMLAGGYFWLRTMASTDPFKLDALMYHMAIGVSLVTLTLIRLLLRTRMAHPETAGLALWVHGALYMCVFLMRVSGFTMGFSSKLNELVFPRRGPPLPDSERCQSRVEPAADDLVDMMLRLSMRHDVDVLHGTTNCRSVCTAACWRASVIVSPLASNCCRKPRWPSMSSHSRDVQTAAG